MIAKLLTVTLLYSTLLPLSANENICINNTVKLANDKYLLIFYNADTLVYNGVGEVVNNRFMPIGTHYFYQHGKIKQLIEYSLTGSYFEGQADIRLKTHFFNDKQQLEKVTLVDYCTDCDKIPNTVWRVDDRGEWVEDKNAVELTQEQPELYWELEQKCR